jgi:hypothetical protein
MGPYIADYNMATGEIWEDNLTKTDEIGLEIMKYVRRLFPEAKPISLYDEYNTVMRDSSLPTGRPTTEGSSVVMPEETRLSFKESLERLFRKNEVILEGEVEGPEADFLLISETEKTQDAPKLVTELEKKGLIEYGADEEIWFQNNIADCEDPRYLRIKLRIAGGKGKWRRDLMSDYRLDFDSYVGPKDTDRLYYLLSIVSEGDELEITMDDSNSEQAGTIVDVLESNEFEVSPKEGNSDGRYHMIAHRRSQIY